MKLWENRLIYSGQTLIYSGQVQLARARYDTTFTELFNRSIIAMGKDDNVQFTAAVAKYIKHCFYATWMQMN